ncbi:MAG TPA: hypothetical protein VJS37_17440 [Terriglobales bacterium]|nr:hypothetical protein [Terriglobales bacterium]
MSTNIGHLRQAFTLAMMLTGFASAKVDSKPNDIVLRHLDAIGPRNVRAAIKSRVVQGNLRFRVLVGGSGGATGTWDLVSSGRMLNLVMQFGIGDWRGEQFTFDGSRIGVARPTAAHQRSEFGDFVAMQDFLLKEGLLGGELSTGWALQNLEANHARIESLGLKKIHGKELLALRYFSKLNSDMQVTMYFDPETYHHLLTVYSLEHPPSATGDIRTSARQKEVRYTLEERFSDFQTSNGITLPRRYGLQWTEELQQGATRLFDWDLTASRIQDDVPVDPANFAVK